MAFFYSHKDALSALKRNSDILDELRKYNCLCSVSFGMVDVCGGYGWHTIMSVSLDIVGEMCEKCEKCGCLYDTTLPPQKWTIAEHSGRHRWTKVTRSVGYWTGTDGRQLRKFFKNCLKVLQNN